MILLFLIGHIASSTFQIISPQKIADKDIEVRAYNFGNPSFLLTYGELVKSSIENCDYTLYQQSKSTFVVLYNTDKCDILSLAKSVQESGAQGVIFVSSSNITAGILLSKDTRKDEISIIALNISAESGALINKYEDGEIWIKYQHNPFLTFTSSNIELMLSSDFGLDKPFITKLEDFINTYADFIFIEEINIRPISVNQAYNEDNCIIYSQTDFACADRFSSSITGANKLNITVLFLNVYSKIKSFEEFSGLLQAMIDLYSKCDIEKSIECAENVFSNHSLPINYDPQVLSSKKDLDFAIPYYSLKDSTYLLWWSDYLEQAFCLTSSDSVNICRNLTQSCTYENVKDSSCSSLCNTTDANYDNLNCLEEDKCYTFLLGNDFCENFICPNDPDCSKPVIIDEFSDDLKLVKILLPLFIAIFM